MAKETMKNRTIRFTDKQWQSYKLYLSDDWLRGQIEKAEKRANRKPTVKAVEE